ncbi:MAG: hypothetical protein ABI977_24920 [Acidobacteriota bacterium]
MQSLTETPLLFGQVKTSLGLSDLLAALKNAGLNAEIHEPDQDKSGQYISLQDEAAQVTFEQAKEEYLVGGEAGGVSELQALAEKVSGVLAAAQLKHRFELYADEDSLVAYFHHDWPQTK